LTYNQANQYFFDVKEKKRERRELNSHASIKLGIKALTLVGPNRSLCVDIKNMSRSGLLASPASYVHICVGGQVASTSWAC
jgi:hypothetical protein